VDCSDWDWGLVGGATGFAHNEIDAEASREGLGVVPRSACFALPEAALVLVAGE